MCVCGGGGGVEIGDLVEFNRKKCKLLFVKITGQLLL